MYTHLGKPNWIKVRVRSPPLKPPNSSRKRGVALDQGCIEKERFEEKIVRKGWSLIRGGPPSWQSLSGWSLIRVDVHQGGPSSGGLSPGWSFIMLVLHQGGLLLGWSFIRFFFHKDRPSSGWSFIGCSLLRVILHRVVYLGCWTSPPSSHTFSSSLSAVCL